MFIVALITERHEYDGEETSLSANNPQIFSTRDERVFQNSASYFENHVKPMLPVIFSQNENEIKTPVIYDIEFEPELQKILWKACEEFDCPYELALSVIYCETRYKNDVGDNGDSIGYMQIQPKWHYKRMKALRVESLADPESNFRVGCMILSEYIEENNGSIEDALSCYNTGSPGSREYSDKVLSYALDTFGVDFS